MSSTEFPVDKILLGIVQCIGYQSYNCGWRRRINMKLKRLAALVLAVMMTLAAASVTGLSKLAAEGTQKPEESVVDAAGATWYHADAGEELRFDDDSSYCFESESWIMRQKSGNTIDEAVFDGITPDNVQTLTDENGETYTVSMYSQATVVAALNRMLGKETKKPERTLVERYKIDDEGMIDVIIKLSGDAVLENGGAVLGEGLTKQQSAAREKLAAEHEIIKKRIECAASAISFEYDFTLLCNGFAASVPFNEVSRIAAVAGVESVEYMPVFEIPTESYEIVRPDDTKMTIANDVIESRYAWDLGIDGSGMVIAIIDTGIDTDNECFAPGLETVKLTQEDISRIIAENPDMNMLALRPGTTAEQVYINDKIPFAFDYADKDCDVNHGGQASAHGTHVAGIAAGQAVESAGTSFGLTSLGVAPKAQILPLKVFSNRDASATLGSVAAAMEDAIVLGADAINLSLGAVGGPVYYEDYTEVFDAALANGINVVASAGNSASSTYHSLWEADLGLTDNPDIGMVGMPGSFNSVLTVASLNNPEYFVAIQTQDALLFDDAYPEYGGSWKSRYDDKADYEYKVATRIGGHSYEYSIFHTTIDNADLSDVSGKLLFVDYNSELTIDEHAAFAREAGAAALFIFDSSRETTFVDTTREDWTYPVAAYKYDSLTKALEPSHPATIHINPYWDIDDQGGYMSSFSSWGTTGGLTIKPEITAIGGNVFSAYNGSGAYALSSGTSMSAPMTAGSALLVRQYLMNNFDIPAAELPEIVNNLLMSAATPVLNPDGLTYSPRYQGAGFENIRAAMTAGAYITTECGRAKLELGDDPQKTGVYNLNFTVVNMTDADKTYTVDASVQTESAETGRINADGTRRYLMTQTPHMLNSEIAGNGAITVPAGGSTEVSVTITLTEEDIAYIEKYFPNGIYVEGFVTLTAGEENGVDLSAPFLAFYGDWLALPAIEQSSYYDFTEIETGECDATHVVNGVYTYDANYDEYIGLGTSMAWPNNSVYPTEELGTMRYVANRNAISPNGDSIRDAIDAIAIGLNRNVENFYYSVANAETGVEYYRKDLGFVPKTYYNDNAGQALYVGAYDNEEFDWDYTDLEGSPLPNNTKLTVAFCAELAYNGRERTEKWEMPLTIDTESPIKNVSMVSYEWEYEEWSDEEDDYVGTGEYYHVPTIVIDYSENQYMDWNCGRAAYVGGASTSKVFHNSVEPGTVNGTTRLGLGPDDLSDINSFLFLECMISDYAGNGLFIRIERDDRPGIYNSGELSDSVVNLRPGETYTVSAHSDIWDLFTDFDFTWSVEDESVASVAPNDGDVFSATITANEIGSTTLKLTNGFLREMTCTINVVAENYDISASAGLGGTISPDGTTTVDSLGSASYTITPNEGWHVADIIVDGESVGAANEYTFDCVIANHTIEAVFASDNYFNVYFVDWDGTTIRVQTVGYGMDAEAPADPVREGYDFIGWSGSFTGITANTVLVAQYEPASGILVGDVDGDGIVTAADALLVMRYCSDLAELTPEQLEAADFNGNGVVELIDALLILRAVI